MPPNPLLDFADLPDFSAVAPKHAKSAVRKTLARAQKAIDDIAQNPEAPRWENTFAPLQDAEESVARVWNQVEHLRAVAADQWQKAHADNLGSVAAFHAELGQNAPLCKRLQALAESPAGRKLPPHRRKALRDSLRDFELSGVNLRARPRRRFRAAANKLAALAARFDQNLLAAINNFHLDVAAESDLGEMPADLKSAARDAAKRDGQRGFRFTMRTPSYLGLVTHSPVRDLREKMHRARAVAASEFGPAKLNNTPVVNEILKLRRDRAKMLGRNNYAECALESRMAKTPKRALEFVRDFAARAVPQAREELAELREFAASELNIPELQPWDVAFASEQLRRKKFDFAAADLRPYLQGDRVVSGLFAFAEKTFGAKFEAKRMKLWSPDAKFFVVKNARDGEPVGRMFADLRARETKRAGAWMADALGRARFCDGRLQLPAAHMNCDFSRPPGGRPALLGWDETTVLFHEFGHALHHLLTERDDYAVSGLNGLEWDAVEWPSQLMENFVWDFRVVAPLTSHEKTGRRMPRALFDKVNAARKFQAGLFLCRQLEFALFDLLLHSSATPPPVLETLSRARSETRVVPALAEDRLPCGFSHIFSGGYAAGYYSYLWAEALAADSFAMFEQAAASRGSRGFAEVGMKFRREALAVGGGRPAMESFRAFRGRDLDLRPLLAKYGLR